ncbi:MAG: biotin/lipoyl-binding protein [Coleofasciculaceae cyanobacterium]
MPNILNSHVPKQAQITEVKEEKLAEPISPTQVNNQQPTSDDWSDATKELLDALPQVWTRGLLYFLVVFLGIILPWAILSKVDETGIAQGRLEPNGKTFKLDAAVTGTIAKLNVKAGEKVEAGQSLVELESELVSNDIQQVKEKLAGQKDRLHQLNLIKSQLEIALSTQQQQNQAQELEKQSQVEQVRQQVVSLQNSYRLQQEEKEAQLNQARESLIHSQKAYQLAESRLANSQTLVQRYRTAFEEGIVAEIEVMGREDLAQEKQRIWEQAQSDFEQAKLRLEEQESSYQRNIKY